MTHQPRLANREKDGGASEALTVPLRKSALDRLGGIEVSAVVELGRAQLRLRDLSRLSCGSVVRLDRLTGEAADLVVNGRVFARGEIVIVDDHLALQITELASEAA